MAEEYRYSPLGDAEKTDPNENQSTGQRSRGRISRAWIFHGTVFVLYTALYAILVASSRKKSGDPQVVGDSYYSPASDAITFKKYTFDPALAPSNETVYFQELPTQEIEDAWLELEAAELVNITPEEAAQLQTPTTVHRGHHVITLEVMHQIHCLNLLRTGFFADEYEGLRERNKKPYYIHHANHCVESIRQSLMCASDVTPIAIAPAPAEGLAMVPQFSTEHMCRDFDAVYKWAMERTVVQEFDKFPRLKSTLAKEKLDQTG